jgi:hypothetical protein
LVEGVIKIIHYEKDQNRYRDAIRVWIPLSAAGALISFLIGLAFHVPLRQMIFAMIFSAALIFSGYIFRSFGRDKEKYKSKDGI